MKINSIHFGEIEFEENLIIQFSEGIIGFEKLQKFLLINNNNGLFLWLTSIDEPDIVFPLFAVEALYNNFPQVEGFETFGIVKLDREPGNITINLKSPVYISEKTKNGFQRIIDSDNYPINYNLFKNE
ncbi:MAG: flagellar assembly protein FliW [Ignavibacteriales bacterium]|nr:flagellar assembly protein FliW [Ignavibacteriales bacterium]